MDNNQKKTDLSREGSDVIARAVVKFILKKLARDVKLIYVRENTVLTDYYVVCTARSSNHLRSLVNEVADEMALCGVHARHPEGAEGGEWALLDIGEVILHVFTKESREFYRFERLFDEKTFIATDDIVAELDEEMSASPNA